MKKNLFAFAALLFAAILPQFAMAQAANSDAKVEIVSGLTIVATGGASTLDFGKLNISATNAGTVTLDTEGNRSSTGGVVVLNSIAATNASFDVSGVTGATYAITLPSSDVTVTHTDGVTTMTITDFKARPASAGADATTGTLDATTGAETFKVGATLNVDAAQTVGVYSATFEVSVAYN